VRLACSSVPSVIFRVTSKTRLFFMRLITVAIHSPDQIRKQARPRPAVSLTLSQNARFILPGLEAHPSVHTSRWLSARPHVRTCCRSRSARVLSRVRLTTPASHNRLETIIANPIHTIIPRAFTRMRVSLDMDHIELSLFNESMMDSLTGLSGTISPRGYCAFIQTIGLHNGLDRTPKG